ncbi:Bug family tripartite tricarboxylate transporter substrate binding protein [Cupriavidus sp. 2TAF22]|uniref:Bug family tripartite tricarboxylate transporter substrate binding protein n=1 Tax=unclassified Cupriavidus TaxID=2640874 RepID=UPI003F8D9BE5
MLSFVHRAVGAAALALAGLALSPAPAHAQDKYPSRPIKMYVGFSAGSATDIVARVVAQHLSERLGQSIVVENKTGVGGSLAAEAVARAAPDGYTLLTVSSAIAVNPAVYPKLSFNIEKDLTPIVLIGRLPTVLLVNNGFPAKSLAEFLAYARSHPKKVNYGSSGVGGSTHLTTEYMATLTGTSYTHVPYRGNAQAIAALLGGEIDMVTDTILLAAPNIQAKRVRALAISSQARSPLAPDVPTFAEAGLQGYDGSLFFGLMGPKDMPPEIVARVNREFNDLLKSSPELRQRLQSAGGLDLSGGSVAGFRDMLHKEVALWRDVVRTANVTAPQ